MENLSEISNDSENEITSEESDIEEICYSLEEKESFSGLQPYLFEPEASGNKDFNEEKRNCSESFSY